MIELLKKLAQLEPERCQVDFEEEGEIKIRVHNFDHFRLVADFWENRPQLFQGAEMIIQYSIQEAITNRHWTMVLKRLGWNEPYWKARITTENNKPYEVGGLEYKSPAQALLAAYVLAIGAAPNNSL